MLGGHVHGNGDHSSGEREGGECGLNHHDGNGSGYRDNRCRVVVLLVGVMEVVGWGWDRLEGKRYRFE